MVDHILHLNQTVSQGSLIVREVDVVQNAHHSLGEPRVLTEGTLNNLALRLDLDLDIWNLRRKSSLSQGSRY